MFPLLIPTLLVCPALLSPSAVLCSLSFSRDPGLLMTFPLFASLLQLTAVDDLESAFGVGDI